MNTYELAELRIMLNGIGMRDWTVHYKKPDPWRDTMLHGDMNGFVMGVLVCQPFYLKHPGSGEVVDIYREIVPGGKPILWHVGMRYIKSHDAWEWRQQHTELKDALSNLNVQLHRAKVLT